MDKKLIDKIAIVTGGVNGIGKAIAKIFIENGAKVVIIDLDQNYNQDIPSFNLDYLCYDVSIEKNWLEIINYIEKKYQKLNILVNNAGINGFEYTQNPENMSLETWDYIHKINLTSVFLGCKYGMKLMKKSNQNCSIVNIASRSGILGVPNLSAYASSKAAIRNYTKSLALYCAQKGYKIRCNSISSAAIDTRMWDHLKKDKNKFKLFIDSLPLKRMGTVDEVAFNVLHLASDQSLYTTASDVIIDGGILSAGIGLPK
ncbi:SDR family oxidoreductase (plasmid) [Candidatus Bandiella numerosa]|uniref:SDR family NAD(P)-dependent oxidoreductase n=1 Tax=Candidatus Bandiella numerosa TaxID=2570586 RepID=UPI00249F609A|nr:SDR family oxidoreductase [Candidatus Bandiella numerosa]WHA05727.1 SDR family oxidoreductase [Candidatus Bandiella numerosa]